MEFKRCKYCSSETELVNKILNLVECHNCGLIFSRTKFSQKELKEKYAELYNAAENPKYAVHSINDFNNLKNGKIKVGYNRAGIIQKSVKENDKVLEIGAGVGLVGAYLSKKYPKVKYEGIELDPETGEKARALGIEVHTGDFSMIGNLERRYDVIMMWEVLEHIQDVKSCLELIHQKLNRDSLLIFSVPNYDKKLNFKGVDDRIFQSGPPVHLNFFRKSSIASIFNSHLFQVKHIKVKRFPYANLFSKSFYKMIPKVILGTYHGPTLYAVIRIKQ